MQETRVWRALMGLKNTVVEGVEFDEDCDAVVVHVRPTASRRGRCGRCGRRSPGYDGGNGRRRWRALDLGTVRAFVEADAPRVRCRRHGVTVAAVPWARHDAGHTRDFDDQVAWLATVTSKTAVTNLMRVAWRTVGSIIARVWAETGGDLPAVYGALLAHPAALAPPLRKVRQPYDFMIASFRALGMTGAVMMALEPARPTCC